MKRAREHPLSAMIQKSSIEDDDQRIERNVHTHGVQGNKNVSANMTTATATSTSRLLVLVSVLLIFHKFAICLEFLNLTPSSTQVLSKLFWLPSLFLEDIFFLTLLSLGARRLPFCFIIVLAIYTATIIMLNLTWLLLNQELFPWHMATWAWIEREVFLKMIVSSLTKELPSSYFVVFVAPWATFGLLWLLLKTRDKNRGVGILKKRHSSRALLPVSSHQETSLPSVFSLRTYSGQSLSGFWLLLAFYLVLSQTIRPAEPYGRISGTPFVSVPLEISKGIRDFYSERSILSVNGSSNSTETSDGAVWDEVIKEIQDMPSYTDDKPMNVVLIFLESVRSDMMPFENSTAWAERFLENPRRQEWEHITPFYANWVQHPSTRHIPLIKSASGFTAKSLFSTLCSSHALPMYHTREHTSKLYRQCLPQILQKLGYATQFFQSPTESFDHQLEMMQNIGFRDIFGKESFDRLFNTTQEFEDFHTANYFGYEDDVFLEPMMDWVDKQMSNKSPFFLSYLTGVTHDPYNIPPRAGWNPKTFSRDATANGYLNGLAYTDDFLRKLTTEFELRGLMESTLFVFVGDHGGDFADRGSIFKTWSVPFEEAFDVSVSFHTRRTEWSQILGAMDHDAQGTWSSIDILPTIVEILLPGVPKALLDGRRNGSLVDGRSMLHPSGQRLLLSIPNPGCGMILRDGPFSIIVNCDESRTTTRVYDLNTDPGQKTKLFLVNDAVSLDPKTKKLLDWGEKAFVFLARLKADLIDAHKTGIACFHCALSSLLLLNTLNDWDEHSVAEHSINSSSIERR
jgi:hypothetical protein